MKAWIGKSFIIIGIIHTAFGLVVCHTILGQLVREGLFNTISGQYDRESAFWFLFSGFAIIIIGALVNWCEHMDGQISPQFSWLEFSRDHCFWCRYNAFIGILVAFRANSRYITSWSQATEIY
ncbi:hypothetical protein KKC52_05950 [bacterium]|nr:hypothetical protein [bacterium]